MAKMLGTIPQDRWEREVRIQLSRQLPADWIVISNLLWALRTPNGYVRDGQADLVVLAPGLGMVVIEVKGSREFHVGEDGVWYRRERIRRTDELGPLIKLDEPPTDQANRNMHSLVALVVRELNTASFPGLYAYVVAYPNGEISRPPPMFDASTVVTSRQMNQLGIRLRQALLARGDAKLGQRFTQDVANITSRVLTNQDFIVSGRDTSLDALEDAADIQQLTRQQFAAIRGLFDLPRVAVIGPAGSGKTLLAIWRLQALLEEGKRAAYVCFNRALAEALRIRHPDCADAIESVDRLFMRITGRSPRGVPGESFFREDLPASVMDAAFSMDAEARYDALLVDEGQDFGEYRIMALLELLKSKGSHWAVFADWRQDIFKAGMHEALGADVIFRLHHNCRNTASVNNATNRLFEQSVESMPGVPIGLPPLIVRSTSRELMAARAWELAQQWQKEGSVVFLSPYKLENSCMGAFPKGYGLTLTEDLGQLGSEGSVYFSTVKSFKGIEAPCVILVDATIPGENQAFSEEDLYVACTRPTSRLAILTTSEEALTWLQRATKQ